MRILLLPLVTCFNAAYFVPAQGRARSGCFAMPPEDGDCETNTDHWFYDSREGVCANFMYGDCPQPGNDFPTKEDCESNCKGKGQQKPQPPEGPGKWPPKGHKPPHKWPKPPGKGTNRPGKGSEEENEVIKGPGGGGRYWPRPPMRPPWPPRKIPQKPGPRPPSKGAGGGTCAARAVRKKWGKSCSGYGDMWFNNAGFYTCSRVKEGYCPTVGTFYATCEECMEACQPRKIEQCQYYR